MLAQSSSFWELHTTVLHIAPIPHVVEHSLQFPTIQNRSMLTGSLAITLLWSLTELLTGLCGLWFWLLERPPLGQEDGFLEREVELFFLGVTAGFFSLMIFTVGWGDAAVVNGFLAVVEGALVIVKPAFDVTEWYAGVVRGTLCVLGLYGLVRGVVWGLGKG